MFLKLSRAAYNVAVSPSWLKECCLFLRMNGPSSTQLEAMTKFVFQKFLDFDLAASAALRTLPQQLPTQHHVKLFTSKPVILQVRLFKSLISKGPT
jgi:hypothetical protein